MVAGLLGKKIGMTQFFAEDGTLLPVTVILAGPCPVMQVKSKAKDGYDAIQLGFDDRRRKSATKPESGHARAAKTEPKRFIREVAPLGADKIELGQVITVNIFKDGEHVDVIGTTIGKGFQGGMKRYGFHGHKASHGASKDHRAPGSIGANTDPGHVWKGTRMAGHMGNARKTTTNLKVVKVDTDKNLLLLKGAVPGAIGSYVIVRARLRDKRKQS
jgi:large subunit ribosomal protein L3